MFQSFIMFSPQANGFGVLFHSHLSLKGDAHVFKHLNDKLELFSRISEQQLMEDKELCDNTVENFTAHVYLPIKRETNPRTTIWSSGFRLRKDLCECKRLQVELSPPCFPSFFFTGWVHASYFDFLCSAFCDWTWYESGFHYHQHHRHYHPNHASRHLYTRLVLPLFGAFLATKPKTPARHSCEAQSSLQGNFCHTWSHFGRYFTTQSANSHIKKKKI